MGAPRADWGDPVLQHDVEATVADLLHGRDLMGLADEWDSCAAQWRGRAERARKARDEHNKDGDRCDDFRGTRLWYKFHGQMQAYESVAKHFAQAAKNARSRLLSGERA